MQPDAEKVELAPLAALSTFQEIIDNPKYDTLTKGLAYHNMAQTILNRCGEPQATCTPADMEQIIEYENIALGIINDRRGQSAATVTWGAAHFVLGETATAEAAFEKAIDLNDNPQEKQQIKDFIIKVQR